MPLSRLQRYILSQTLAAPKRLLHRVSIERFYVQVGKKFTAKGMANVISRSVDRLINNHLLVGYGRKTARKWFVERVRLTPKGRGVARRMLGEQQTLPLRLTHRQRVSTARNRIIQPDN